jgi:type II secretory pathway pseudopilin PulG
VVGFSLIELMFVLGVAAAAGTLAVPRLLASIDEFRAGGAARVVAAMLQEARTRALTRSRDTAVRITHDAHGYLLRMYEDGNDNGVLSAEIAGGVDVAVGLPTRLGEQFHGVDFGALAGIPGVEGSAPPGADPVRLGASDAATFTPSGTATSGSLYLTGGGATQYVVRLYGETGRTRILKYHAATRRWLPL